MSRKYQLWDKTSNIYTPVGECLTPEQWIERYGWINIPSAKPVVSYGMINGGFIGELSEMKTLYENQGAIFEDGLTDAELLTAIEEFEDELNAPVETVSTDERIAAALEAQVMMSMPDEEEVI